MQSERGNTAHYLFKNWETVAVRHANFLKLHFRKYIHMLSLDRPVELLIHLQKIACRFQMHFQSEMLRCGQYESGLSSTAQRIAPSAASSSN